MDCNCKSDFSIKLDENVEELIKRTLFGCLKAWILFWIRKLTSCAERQPPASEEEQVEAVDDSTKDVHETQVSTEKVSKE